jgi:acylphosphatase
MEISIRLRVAGRVQGVGFRQALLREAVSHGLRGWVRNRRDGTVEALLQGDAAAVEAVIAWAHRGPPASRVDRVDAAPVIEDQRHAGFEQLPTE